MDAEANRDAEASPMIGRTNQEQIKVIAICLSRLLCKKNF